MGMRDASTVVLGRSAAGGGIEILLIRRHRASAFMGGAFVFPGGKLDPQDSAPALLDRVRAEDRSRAARVLESTFDGPPLAPEVAAGLFAAACRETYEEVGVLLAASRGSDRPVSFQGKGSRFVDWRARLLGGEATFVQMLEAEDLELTFGGLGYFAHWVTPSGEKRRYDTRFFVAELPPGQSAALDEREITELRWSTPAEAVAAYRRGELFLPPPTVRTLEEIEDAKTWDQVQVEAERRAGSVVTILPKLAVHPAGGFQILLPWDPEYETTDGDGWVVEDPDPEAQRASRLAIPLR